MTICINDDKGKRLYPIGGKSREDSENSKSEIECSSVLNLEEAAGLISLSGIGRWNMDSIDDFQHKKFRSFALYGNHTFQRMRKVQETLKDKTNPPVIVSIGQEGGIVHRFGWIKDLKAIYAGMLCKTKRPELAEKAGFLTGQLMRLYGINLNLAPFMDLHAYEPPRRYSDNPQEIAKYAGAFMQGLLRAGVGACAKHFPDGGDKVAGNPHDKVVKVNYTMDEMKIKERYQPLIDKGLPAIMMSHVIFSKIDPHPAVLSKKWVTEILRGEMGFKGLIISDAMEMKAIDHPSLKQAEREDKIIAAFNAGVDVILADPKVMRQALTRGVLTGKISPQRIQESAERILAFQKKYPVNISDLASSQRQQQEAIILRQIKNLYQAVDFEIKKVQQFSH